MVSTQHRLAHLLIRGLVGTASPSAAWINNHDWNLAWFCKMQYNMDMTKRLKKTYHRENQNYQTSSLPSTRRSIGEGIVFILLCMILVLSTPLIIVATFFQGLWVNAHPFWYFLPITLMLSCFSAIILSLILGVQNLRRKMVKPKYYIVLGISIAMAILAFTIAIFTLKA